MSGQVEVTRKPEPHSNCMGCNLCANCKAEELMEVFIGIVCYWSVTSGAIQHGVPTKVCLDFALVRSPPDASQAETPKSAIW